MSGGDKLGIPCRGQEAGGRALQTLQNELRKERGAAQEVTKREGCLGNGGRRKFSSEGGGQECHLLQGLNSNDSLTVRGSLGCGPE